MTIYGKVATPKAVTAGLIASCDAAFSTYEVLDPPAVLPTPGRMVEQTLHNPAEPEPEDP